MDNPFWMWLFAAILTLLGASVIYVVSWVVMTLVAAIAAAGSAAWIALGGVLFLVSVVLAFHIAG